MTEIVVATRRSKLALAQARAWIAELGRANPGLEVAELHVTTTGDKIQDRALREVGGKALFIKEIEEAILDGRAQIAVHSMKDVPAELAPGLVIGCVPAREDPRDVIVSREGCRFEELPPGSTVGTSSLRREALLRDWRPDLKLVPLRGNVDTRLRKCEEGEMDAIVLAYAGLRRLGLGDRATEVLDVERIIPAVGQGALGIERRDGAEDVAVFLRPLADPETTIAVAAERGVMTAVEGSCQVPVAGHAVRLDGNLLLRAMLADPDAKNVRKREARTSWPKTEKEAHRFGVELGLELKAAAR